MPDAVDWSEFTAEPQESHDHDWSQYESVPDPKALQFGIQQSVALPNVAARAFNIGLQGIEPTENYLQMERGALAQGAPPPTSPEEVAAQNWRTGGMATATGTPMRQEDFTLLPIPHLENPFTGGTGDLARVLGVNPTPSNQATLAMLGAPQPESQMGTLTAGANVLGGFGRFAGSPEGLGAAALASTGPLGAGAVGTYFAGKTALEVPALARESGRLSVEGTPQEARESLFNLAAAIGVPAGIVAGFFKAGWPATDIYNWLNGRAEKQATVIPPRTPLPSEPIDIQGSPVRLGPLQLTEGEANASTVPENQGIVPTPGQTAEGGGEAGGNDVQQPPPGPPNAPGAPEAPVQTEVAPQPSGEDVASNPSTSVWLHRTNLSGAQNIQKNGLRLGPSDLEGMATSQPHDPDEALASYNKRHKGDTHVVVIDLPRADLEATGKTKLIDQTRDLLWNEDKGEFHVPAKYIRGVIDRSTGQFIESPPEAPTTPAAATPPQPAGAPEVPSWQDLADQAGAPPVPEGQLPVRVQLADGTVVPGIWKGYQEAPGFPKYDKQPYVAVKFVGDKWSHGLLPPGAKILDQIPSFEDWKAGKKEATPTPTSEQPQTGEPPVPPAAKTEGEATSEEGSPAQSGTLETPPSSPAGSETTPTGQGGTVGQTPSVVPPTTPTEEGSAVAPTLKAADEIKDFLVKNPTFNLTKQIAHDIIARHMGGTLAQGKFTAKDQSDIIELVVNRYVNEKYDMFNPEVGPNEAVRTIEKLKNLLQRLPTQTTRTAETDAMQQFSTPPTEAFAANWVAKVGPDDVALEPSAGIGGLAVFAKNAGATVIANELSPRRAELLGQSGIVDHLTTHNAEQLHAILTPAIASGQFARPTVVVMNPPFSKSAKNDQHGTMVGAQHVEQALKLLPKGGRLVAIVGEGMAEGRPAFTAWWNKIKAKYNVRANIGVNGEEYRKYGTTFGNQMLVIDNTGPTAQGSTVTGSVDKVQDLIPLLEKVRNDRPTVESAPAQPGSRPPTQTGAAGAQPQGNAPAPTGGSGSGGSSGNTGTGQRPAPQGSPGLPVQPPNTGVSPQPPAGPSQPGGNPPQGPGQSGGSAGNAPAESGSLPDKPVGQAEVETKAKEERPLGEGIFSNYVPQKVNVPGASKHPAPLVESTAMASVEPVDPTHKPHLDKKAISYLSNEQLEQIIYAGQAHELTLPNGDRQGYFIGDGTGVGKTAENMGIIMDNWNQGRRKALWITAKTDLIKGAKGTAEAMGFNPDHILDFGKSGGKLVSDAKQGVAFVTYNSMSIGYPGLEQTPEGQPKRLRPPTDPKKPSRMQRFYDWVGKDFDGVIILDESHFAGNAVDTRSERGVKRASERGKMVVDLQALFPKARVVYSSATGATQVSNLSYADRLGIWGPGTPFPNKQAFFSAISGAGLSAMEIVARDLKSTGKYLARTLSFDGVQQDPLPHKLTPEQVQIYDEMSRAWQLVLRSINDSMATTGVANHGRHAGQVTGQFWGAAQRFYNQLLTAMQTPTIIASIKQSLANGHSAVIQVVNTNESTLNREMAKKGAEAAEAGETDWIEDMDLSPKDILLDYVDNHYPTQLYAPETDANGNTVWVPQALEDGTPIHSPEALEEKQRLMDQIKLTRAPANPLEMILDTFGEENVAEITGRKKRVVNQLQPDGTRKKVVQSRSDANLAVEKKEFDDHKRRILIFSDKGGTGSDYHSGRNFKNQEQRDHYGAQLGWQADKAVQGLGRTNRTNQAHPPHYFLPSTDIPGHKRFISTIMRRLSELGALTGGERKAAAQSLFKESDDLETAYAQAAVYRFFNQLFGNMYPDMSFMDITRKMGFTRQTMNLSTGEMEETNTLIDPSTGNLKQNDLPPIEKFLNRVLILEKAEQEKVFNAFDELRETMIDNAKADGSYDPGTQTVKALAIRKIGDEVVYKDPKSTATTRLVTVESDHPVKTIPWERIQTTGTGPVSTYAKNLKSGRVFALKPAPAKTLENGTVVEQWRRIWPTGYDIVPRNTVVMWGGNMGKNYDEIEPQEAQRLWGEQLAKAPKVKTDKDTYVVGAFLPIWDRLRLGRPRIWRMTTDKGENLLGAHVPEAAVDDLRDRLGAGGEQLTPKAAYNRVLDSGQSINLANGWVIKRSRVQGDMRIEVRGPQLSDIREFENYLGGRMERINFEPRFFFPTDEDAALESLRKLLIKSPAIRQRTGLPPSAPPAAGYFPRMSEALGLGEQAGPPTLEQIRQSREANRPGQLIAEPADSRMGQPLMFYSGLPLPAAMDLLRDLPGAARTVGNAAQTVWDGLSLKGAPRITALDRVTGEKAVRLAWAKTVARDKGILFAEQILKGITDPDYGRKLGAGISEDNLRWLKDRNLRRVYDVEHRDELIQQALEEIENYRDDARSGDATAKAIIAELRRRIATLQEYTDEDADRFQQLADNTFTFIGAPGSPFRTEAEYRAFMNGAQNNGVLQRYRNLWRQVKDPLYRLTIDVDPNAPLESRGLDYGARINLYNLTNEGATPTTARRGGSSQFIRQNATVKQRNRFSMAAEGQGEAYEADLRAIMANAFDHEYPVAAQHDFLNHLIDNGLGVVTRSRVAPGLEIRGEPTVGYELHLRPYGGRWLQVPKSMAHEYEAITGLSPLRTLPIFTALGELATKLSVTGIAEGGTHAANLMMETFLGAGPTANPLINALIKSIPGRPDLLFRVPWVIIRGLENNREQLISFMERGFGKKPYSTGLGVGALLNVLDRGSRAVAHDIYKGMAANGWVEDSETGLREFVNQIGNYEQKLQPWLIRQLRATQVQPFATAVSNFAASGLRKTLLQSGAAPKGHFARLALMADILGGVIGLVGTVGVINYLLSGDPFGPKGTQLGDIGWIGDDKKLHTFPVGQLTGLTRGLRFFGAQSYIEARREGLTQNQALKSGAAQAANSAVSFVTGPLIRGATMAFSGARPDQIVNHVVRGGPLQREAKPALSTPDNDPLKSQLANNIVAALRTSTPLADAVASYAEGKPLSEIAQRQLTRYMPRTGPSQQTIASLPKIVSAAEVNDYADALSREARKLPISQRWQFISQRMREDQVTPQQRGQILIQMKKHGTLMYQ